MADELDLSLDTDFGIWRRYRHRSVAPPISWTAWLLDLQGLAKTSRVSFAR